MTVLEHHCNTEFGFLHNLAQGIQLTSFSFAINDMKDLNEYWHIFAVIQFPRKKKLLKASYGIIIIRDQCQ